MHESSWLEMKYVLDKYLRDRDMEDLFILDVGSRRVKDHYGHTYREHMRKNWTYFGCDIKPGENVDFVMGDMYSIQLDTRIDDCYDVVISGQCLEHVPEPKKLVTEMVWILKPCGLIVLTAPWRWKIHHRPDYWRITPDGMEFMLTNAGANVMEVYTKEKDCWGIGVKKKK